MFTRCKFSNCSWEGGQDGLLQHCEQNHKGFVRNSASGNTFDLSFEDVLEKETLLLSNRNSLYWFSKISLEGGFAKGVFAVGDAEIMEYTLKIGTKATKCVHYIGPFQIQVDSAAHFFLEFTIGYVEFIKKHLEKKMTLFLGTYDDSEDVILMETDPGRNNDDNDVILIEEPQNAGGNPGQNNDNIDVILIEEPQNSGGNNAPGRENSNTECDDQGIQTTECNQKENQSGLLEMFKCSICLNYIRRNARFCLNRHFMCNNCYEELRQRDLLRCPVCRGDFLEDNQCQEIEKLLQTLQFPDEEEVNQSFGVQNIQNPSANIGNCEYNVIHEIQSEDSESSEEYLLNYYSREENEDYDEYNEGDNWNDSESTEENESHHWSGEDYDTASVDRVWSEEEYENENDESEDRSQSDEIPVEENVQQIRGETHWIDSPEIIVNGDEDDNHSLYDEDVDAECEDYEGDSWQEEPEYENCEGCDYDWSDHPGYWDGGDEHENSEGDNWHDEPEHENCEGCDYDWSDHPGYWDGGDEHENSEGDNWHEEPEYENYDGYDCNLSDHSGYWDGGDERENSEGDNSDDEPEYENYDGHTCDLSDYPGYWNGGDEHEIFEGDNWHDEPEYENYEGYDCNLSDHSGY